MATDSDGTPAKGKQPPGGAPAAALSVDRLVLHVPPMSEAEARSLAELVGQALRDWPTAPAASGRIGRLDTRLASSPNPPSAAMGPGGAGAPLATEQLARRIAESVLAAALREVR